MGRRLGIVIVAYGNEAELPALLRAVVAEKRAGDQIILIDNHPKQGCANIAEQIAGVDSVLRSENIGFAAGANKAARALPDTLELLLFLNPDVLPQPGAITELRGGTPEDWGAWMGVLVLPDGTINSAGNVIHLSGLSWCDAYGQPVAVAAKRQQVEVVSGACLVIRRSAWDKIGGFAEEYFMYYEDTDLSVSLRRQGLRLGIVPAAVFVHDYVYDKSPLKWFYLERNRYVFIARQWPLGVILLFLPLLIAVEAGLWAVSLSQGRLLIRVKAVGSFLKILPQACRSRRQIRQQYPVSSSHFLEYLQPSLNTPLLGGVGQSKLFDNFFRSYYRAARWLAARIGNNETS